MGDRSLTRCTAVGSFQTGSPNSELLAEHWNGTTWAILNNYRALIEARQ